METYIKLSWWQRWKLRKFFKGAEDANLAGDRAAIGAQIWNDGMHVRLFNAERGKALSDALGGKWEEGYGSMASKRNSATTKP
jgi:hypothetical protein